jgi:hypothetical protein
VVRTGVARKVAAAATRMANTRTQLAPVVVSGVPHREGPPRSVACGATTTSKRAADR